jgi:hypothetical protein
LREAYEEGTSALGMTSSGSLEAVEVATRTAFWLADGARYGAAAAGFAMVKDHGRVVDASKAEVEAGQLAFSGQLAEAAAAYADAVRRRRELDTPLDLVLTLMGYATVSRARQTEGAAAEAATAESEAREILRRLGAGQLGDRFHAWQPAVVEALVAAAAGSSDREHATAGPPEREAQRS